MVGPPRDPFFQKKKNPLFSIFLIKIKWNGTFVFLKILTAKINEI